MSKHRLPEWASSEPEDHDLREAADLAVPSDERVVVHSVWGVECFGPGTVNGLLANIARLGIEGDRMDRSLAEAVTATRSGHLGGASAQLLPLVRELTSGIGSLFHRPVVAELPAGVERISCEWMSLTASLSAIVCRVDLTNHEALSAHRALCAYARGRTWPSGDGGVRHEPPFMQQHLRFLRALGEHVELVSGWLKANLPGEFALRERRCPAAAMVTARLFDPFVRQQSNGPRAFSYRDAAALDDPPLMRNTHNPSVACAWMRGTHLRGARLLVFGGKVDDVVAGWNRDDCEPSVDLGDDRAVHRDVVNGAARRLSGPTAAFAVHELLGDLLADLARARDQPLSRRGTRGRRRQLATELEATARMVDAGHLAEDLIEGVFPLVFAGYDGADYKGHRPGGEECSLQASLDFNVRRQAALVLRRERRVRDSLSIRADLHSAIAGVDAVRWAAAAIVVALATIAVTLLAG